MTNVSYLLIEALLPMPRLSLELSTHSTIRVVSPILLRCVAPALRTLPGLCLDDVYHSFSFYDNTTQNAYYIMLA